MSLVKTLAKVAIGVAVAKGVSSMAKGGTTTRQASNPGTGSVFGGASTGAGGGMGGGMGGGLGDVLGQVLGSNTSTATTRTQRGTQAGSQRGTQGGLGDLLGQVLGGAGGASAGGAGSLQDMLGQVLGGGGASQQGGLGGLLEGLSKASNPGQVTASKPSAGSLGDMLNQAIQRMDEPEATPTRDQEDTAALMLRAMIQAAKSDGRIDAEEKKALMANLKDLTHDEMAFVNEELSKPVDVQALARDVPRGLEQQVYMMSLVALDLDSKAEAEYLHALGQALNIQPQMANAIHEKMGEPVLYR